MNAFDPEPTWQLPVIQQEVLEKEERTEPVGEQTAVPLSTQVEPVTSMDTIPGTWGAYG
jgi:hypothetical protein